MEAVDTVREFISQLTILQIGVGVAVLAFLVFGIRLTLRKPPTHLTAFSGDSGTVLVSRKALQELVRSACLLDEWVEAARAVIRVRDNKVTARVDLRLAHADNLKAVCERVQNHITALLQKSLSFDQIGEIQIVVKSFGQSDPIDVSERTVTLQPAEPEPQLPPQEISPTPDPESNDQMKPPAEDKS